MNGGATVRSEHASRAQVWRFQITCQSARAEDIHAMTDAARPISRATFLRYVDPASLREVERALGYRSGPGGNPDVLHIANDWSVGYFRSTYQGRPCVYLVWSGIEHVFSVDPDSLDGCGPT